METRYNLACIIPFIGPVKFAFVYGFAPEAFYFCKVLYLRCLAGLQYDFSFSDNSIEFRFIFLDSRSNLIVELKVCISQGIKFMVKWNLFREAW